MGPGRMIYITEAIDDEQIAFLPSPDAIKAACEAIRATWGPGEEQRRRRWSIAPPVEPMEIPLFDVAIDAP